MIADEYPAGAPICVSQVHEMARRSATWLWRMPTRNHNMICTALFGATYGCAALSAVQYGNVRSLMRPPVIELVGCVYGQRQKSFHPVDAAQLDES